VFCLAGCGKEGVSLTPLPVAQAQEAFDKAFKNASAETRLAVRDAVEALKTTNSTKAVMVLQELSAQSGLTPAQQEVATRGLLTANAMMQTAAANGDHEAAEVIQIRRQNK